MTNENRAAEMRRVTCRSCGAAIVWITTQNGRKMPCNADPVEYQDNRKGKDVIVTEDGKVVRGTVIDKARPSALVPIVDGTGYISHFATCPFADQHRRSR